MIKIFCDRCNREKNSKDFFIKVSFYDFCPKCHYDFVQNLNEFVHNKNQTEVKPNEQEKASNA